MTYNIRNGRGWDRRVDLGRIAAVIAAFDPHVVAMQEVDLDHARSHNVDQATELARRLGMTPHYGTYLDGGDLHGIATLTNLPILATRHLALAGLPHRLRSEPRCALITRVAWPAIGDGTPRHLDIVNTHLSMMPHERPSQVAALTSAFDQDDLIVMGDLNCTTRSAPFRALCGTHPATNGRHLRPAAANGRSWPALLPLMRLDHILVRGSLSVIRAGVFTGGPARQASDHLPVIAELAHR